jgi:hypothetical protein
LARGDDCRINQHFVYRDIAANVNRAQTGWKRNG